MKVFRGGFFLRFQIFRFTRLMIVGCNNSSHFRTCGIFVPQPVFPFDRKVLVSENPLGYSGFTMQPIPPPMKSGQSVGNHVIPDLCLMISPIKVKGIDFRGWDTVEDCYKQYPPARVDFPILKGLTKITPSHSTSIELLCRVGMFI